MVIDKSQIFNLIDTNGRRKDIVNALKVYLGILQELKDNYPTETWSTYPNSVAQYLFYTKAVEQSSDVFKIHKNYDAFLEFIGEDGDRFLNKDQSWIDENLPEVAKILDEAIEKRARHYTSNLVKIGFADSARNITEAGLSYLRGEVRRDEIEALLPVNDTNIVLLRQLLKLKIFSDPNENGERTYYSPMLMALLLLLEEDTINFSTFTTIVQGLGPYTDDSIKNLIIEKCTSALLEEKVHTRTMIVPDELNLDKVIEFEMFKKHFKSSKNSEEVSGIYYTFYNDLLRFLTTPNKETYDLLLNNYFERKKYLDRALGFGKSVFDYKSKANPYSFDEFLHKNKNNPLFDTSSYNANFYKVFENSKWVDGIKEYSDTTVRMLGATGFFKFRSMPELAYKKILSELFEINYLRNSVFGSVSEESFIEYESEAHFYFGKNTTLKEILGFNQEQTIKVIDRLKSLLGVSTVDEIKVSMQTKRNLDFVEYINLNYPKEKVIELLSKITDRRNDKQIQKEVNESATIPTIYEYLIAIAWYYISDKNFNVYECYNLTLNADFEPVVNAGGGAGDIVIDYDDSIIMLEVTLMNKNAQKRGEWEPVLRHSLNLKADNKGKETLTFFVADELDFNTINIWRAVAAVPLESTSSHDQVDGVVIMPFTNQEIVRFLIENVDSKSIINATKQSFDKIPKLTDTQWREGILENL